MTCEVACLARHCACPGAPEATDATDRPDLPAIPDAESALAFAAWLSLLESTERYDVLYRVMHPDARAIIPARVMTRWFRRLAPTRGAEVAVPLKVRFIPWTWGVTGKTYPEAAEVAFRQQLWDGTIVRDEVRLAKDPFGNWGWFFGRDRAFVEEQIARFG